MPVKLSQKVFIELVEKTSLHESSDIAPNEGIITSTDEFIALVAEASKIYYDTFKIPERDQLIIVEDFPRDLLQRLNQQEYRTDFSEDALRDIRVVTYTADEYPASVSAHTPDTKGIRNIKQRYYGMYDDPQYEGYSVVRLGKDIEATVSFDVWGISSHDVRTRSRLLRNIIQNNTWFLKQKGLREIIWLGSVESEMWDKQNLVKRKSEKYLVRFVEIQETREKNIEQVIVQFGVS